MFKLAEFRKETVGCWGREYRECSVLAGWAFQTRVQALWGDVMGEVFLIFLRLGLTSFGGPVAHIGFFREEFVARRKWMTDQDYADLVALCQFLPGPASSQVGFAIGLQRAGLPGAFAAWTAFTLPSAALLVALALGLTTYASQIPEGLLFGLKLVAVAVVAQALWGMSKTLCPDRLRASFAVAGAAAALLYPSIYTGLGIILVGALLGLALLPREKPTPQTLKGERPATGEKAVAPVRFGAVGAVVALLLFFGGFFALPFAVQQTGDDTLALADAFYRAGSLVFGGGHVVLPLLEAEMVDPGWVTSSEFLAGYGAAQAVPGPLFTFSAFLGVLSSVGPGGVLGGLVALLAIFVPAWLLVLGTLPFWAKLKEVATARAALNGVNAAVVGLLGAAFYDPVWVSAVLSPVHLIFALVAFLLLQFWKLPPWLVVIAGGVLGVFVF